MGVAAWACCGCGSTIVMRKTADLQRSSRCSEAFGLAVRTFVLSNGARFCFASAFQRPSSCYGGRPLYMTTWQCVLGLTDDPSTLSVRRFGVVMEPTGAAASEPRLAAIYPRIGQRSLDRRGIHTGLGGPSSLPTRGPSGPVAGGCVSGQACHHAWPERHT